jgi:hypothetical protein
MALSPTQPMPMPMPMPSRRELWWGMSLLIVVGGYTTTRGGSTAGLDVPHIGPVIASVIDEAEDESLTPTGQLAKVPSEMTLSASIWNATHSISY